MRNVQKLGMAWLLALILTAALPAAAQAEQPPSVSAPVKPVYAEKADSQEAAISWEESVLPALAAAQPSYLLEFRGEGETAASCLLGAEGRDLFFESVENFDPDRYRITYAISDRECFFQEIGLKEAGEYVLCLTHLAPSEHYADSQAVLCSGTASIGGACDIGDIEFVEYDPLGAILTWACAEPGEGVLYCVELTREERSTRFFVDPADVREQAGLYRYTLDFTREELRGLGPGTYRAAVYQTRGAESGACGEKCSVPIPLAMPFDLSYQEGVIRWTGEALPDSAPCIYTVRIYSGEAAEGVPTGILAAEGTLEGSAHSTAGPSGYGYARDLAELGITCLTEGAPYCFTVQAGGAPGNDYPDSRESEAVSFVCRAGPGEDSGEGGQASQVDPAAVSYDYTTGLLTWTLPDSAVIDPTLYVNSWFVVRFTDALGGTAGVKEQYTVGTAQPGGDAEVTVDGQTFSCRISIAGLADGIYTVNVKNERLFASGGTAARFAVRTAHPGGSSQDDREDRDDRDERDDSTTTTSRVHPNGSRTVTVTNRITGTVTETTTSRSGTKTVVETKADGTVTTTVSRRDGITAVTVQAPGKAARAQVRISASAADSAGDGILALPVRADTDRAVVEISGVTSAMRVHIPVERVSSATVAAVTGQDGGETILKNAVPANGGLVVLLGGDAVITVRDNVKVFSDVPASFWGREAVDFVTSRELFHGVAAEVFAPEAPMTRQMLMTVLARLGGADTGRAPYAQGAAWARENGISDGSDPTGIISREQMAAMLHRCAGSPAAGGNLEAFSDGAAVSGYALDAVRWAVDNRILTGTGDGRLLPQSPASRVQAAVMLQRYIACRYGL